MKRSVLTILFSLLLILGGIGILRAQEQPAPKKDTVNIDTDAKPEYYYAVEDEDSMKGDKSGNTTMIIIIAAAVIVAGGVALMLLRKKK